MDEQAKRDFKIDFTPFIFQEHLAPTGSLPREFPKESSAAWYFCRCAVQSIETLESQVSYEGEDDVTASLRSLADNIRIQYGISDLNEMMKLIPACRMEAQRLNLPWPAALEIWYQSGGHKLDEVTRDPDKLNIS